MSRNIVIVDDRFKVLENNRVIFLEKNITEESVKEVINKMLLLQDQGNDPIHLFISGQGGDLLPAFWLVTEIENSTIPIFTYCHTSIASSSSFIFMAGHCRIIYPTGIVMLHGIAGTTYGDILSINAQVENIKKLNSRLENYISTKSNLSKEKIIEILKNKETYFFGEEAIDAGIADQIYAGHIIKSVVKPVPDEFYFVPTLTPEVEKKVRDNFKAKQNELNKLSGNVMEIDEEDNEEY